MKAYDGAKPSVGRIVHFYSDDPTAGEPPKAAMIIAVEDNDDCGLLIFNPDGNDWKQKARFSEVPKEECWTWPPRV